MRAPLPLLATLSAALLLTTACAEVNIADLDDSWTTSGAQAPDVQDGSLSWRSGMEGYGVHGVELSNPATAELSLDPWGVVGLANMTCQVYLSSSTTGSDEDVVTGEEDLHDSRPGPDGQEAGDGVEVLVGAGDALVLAAMPGGAIVADAQVPGLIDAEFTFDGYATRAQDQGCALSWHTPGGDAFATVELPAAACATEDSPTSFEMDADADVAWIGAGASIVRASLAGVTEIPVAADLVALDAAGRLYAGARGGHTVTALDADGRVLWTTDLPGGIAGLDDRGAAGQVVVSTAGPFGGGAVVLLDGATGDLVEAQRVGLTPGRVASSPDGRSIAIASDTRIDFFAAEAN